jgi:hypothetical protein
MGYRRQRKVFLLRFEDEPGLEVYAYSAPIGVVLGLMDMVPEDKASLKDGAVIEDLLATFAESLKEWNLEDEDGAPVPATVIGLKTQDLDFVLELILAWVEAVVSVSAPLKKKSSDGDQSPEASIPMDVA